MTSDFGLLQIAHQGSFSQGVNYTNSQVITLSSAIYLFPPVLLWHHIVE